MRQRNGSSSTVQGHLELVPQREKDLLENGLSCGYRVKWSALRGQSFEKLCEKGSITDSITC